MADIDENLAVWNASWDWSDRGDEWSAWWGGTPALWFGAILPRIHRFIPTDAILEIAPGYGRWTQFLKDVCGRLVLVDLAERSIDHCRQRFADDTNIEYHVNDGRSLDMVGDGSIDFAFSFDSLVHAESDVLEAYAVQLVRKLKPDGVGFLHHSNTGSYRALAAIAHRAPNRLLRPLVSRGILLDISAWRAESVTAEGFAAQCEAAGLACVAQEKINWEHGPYLTDAISIVTPRGSRWERPRAVLRNPLFRREARRMAGLYAGSSFQGEPP
jgi:ubiquinone/menaquinone biosynthesis C-methylase UbiE